MSENIYYIIEKIKELKELTSDAQVAKKLGMSRNSLYGYGKRGSLPIKALRTFCLQEGISLDSLLGNDAISAQSDNLHPRPDIASVIHAVTDIMYSGQGEIIDALVKNVQEFKRATETVKRLNACEIELKDLKDEVSGLKKQIDRLTAPPTGADLKAS